MDLIRATLTLPMALAGAMAVHVLAARAIKAVAWSVSPLAVGEPQAYVYERDVWRTAEPGAMHVVAAAAGAGALFWIAGLLQSWWMVLLALLGWAGAVAFDLMSWQRVAVSANNLWFQRGWGQKVHQVAFENIRDVAIEERDERGFTLRRGLNNRICRLQVRMKDKRVVALPKTDAHTGLADVEEVANQLRQRLRHLEDRESIKRSQQRGSEAAREAAEAAPSGDAELRRALRKLRAQATAPDAPKAVKLKNES